MWAVLLLAVAAPWSAGAQDSLDVLDWKSEYTWNKHLIEELHRQYDERARTFEAATTSEGGAAAYRADIQRRYRAITGSFPEMSPLNAEVTGTIERGGYRIEKLVYEGFRDHHVTANLYVPEGEGPFPGVLLFCGHEREAKATPSYQRTAILFAQHGFVVLVIDPISQAERFQLTEASGEPLTRGGTTEHTLLGASSNLVGTSVVNYEYWDNKRGLDYLRTRPEVDTSRIGAVGNSGGATMTMYFAALNDAIDVAAPASYISTRRRSLEVLGPQDACQWIPYEGRQRLETTDFLLMKAPIATLTLAGQYDFVDFVGTKRAQDEFGRFYSALGQPAKTRLFVWKDGHGISKPKREEAVQWFRRWFYDDPAPVEEGDLPVLSEEELQVTASGQVNAEYADEYTIQQRNLDLAEAMQARRAELYRTSSRSAYRQLIDSLIAAGVEERGETLVEVVGTVEVDGHTLEKVILRREGQVPVPALVRFPEATATGTVLWLDHEGKRQALESGALGELEPQVGVVIADVRGVGETTDPARFNPEKYYNSEYRNDQLSLHIGRPVVGQRVNDIVTLLDFVDGDERLTAGNVEVRASGLVASPALHAAVLDERIDALRLSDTVRSYTDILKHPEGKGWYAYVVPGALQYYDLPDLVRFIGADRVAYDTTDTP